MIKRNGRAGSVLLFVLFGVAAHAQLAAPNIPAVRARGAEQDTPWLEFDCDAVIVAFCGS